MDVKKRIKQLMIVLAVIITGNLLFSCASARIIMPNDTYRTNQRLKTN